MEGQEEEEKEEVEVMIRLPHSMLEMGKILQIWILSILVLWRGA